MIKKVSFLLTIIMLIIISGTLPLSAANLKSGTENHTYIDFVELTNKPNKIISSVVPKGFYFHEDSGAVFSKRPQPGTYKLQLNLKENGIKITKNFEIIINKAQKKSQEIQKYLVKINGKTYTKKDIHKLEKKSEQAFKTINKALPDFKINRISVIGSAKNPGQLSRVQSIYYIKNMVNLIRITNIYKNSKKDTKAKKQFKKSLKNHQQESNLLHLQFENSQILYNLTQKINQKINGKN